MKSQYKEKEFASKIRNFIVEFLSVFFIVALNGTFLVLILVNLIDKGIDKYIIALVGALYLLFSCTVSTILIYWLKGRVYSNKIKDFCDAAKKVAAGDFSVRIPVFFSKPKTEMDYLAVNFNKMLVEISSLENMRNNFVADVSHEIKTPLSVVQGYADLLQNKELSAEKRAEYTHRLSQAIESLTNLVTNILNINRIENQEIVSKEEFSLDEQIRCSVLNYIDKIENKNITLDIDLDEAVICSEKSLLEAVWNNLISNAVKFTDEGGDISISLKKEKDYFCVKVADTGCGISSEDINRIFEKFYQCDTSHSQEGNGLGLAMVKQIIDKLGGSIKVSSKVEKGTTFIVYI